MFRSRLLNRPATLLFMSACVLAGQAPTVAQDVTGGADAMPDACRLLPLSDLQALYPGRPITEKGPELSPVSQGPQYAQSCQYVVRLPSGTSRMDVARFVSLSVVRFAGVPDKGNAAQSFAYLMRLRQQLAADPGIGLTVSPLSGIGDEAFAERRRNSTAITTRKQDLLVTVHVDEHAEDAFKNASALARQAASRWPEGTGMVERAEPVAANESVAVPPDTRTAAVAPPEDWPDACALLTRADLARVFPDAAIKDPRPMRGQITHDRRENRIERLPRPIACQYDVRRHVALAGKPTMLNHQAQVSLKNVAATPELSRSFYETSRRVVGPLTPIDGLGDEAGIDPLNRITIRKGVFAIEIKVTGGERDAALHDEAKKRAIELSRIVAGRLP